MSRTAATVTQADVARCLRAAKQVGAGAVEVRPDGHIIILMQPPSGQDTSGKGGASKISLDDEREIVL